MREEEYAKQQIKIGRKLHFNDSTWWEEFAPFYYKPTFLLRKLPLNTHPNKLKSWIGYSFPVINVEHASDVWNIMGLTYEDLRSFNINSLRSSKKGL